jgi:hypothetical protein
MRKIGITGDFLKGFPLFCCTCVWLAVLFLLMDTAISRAAEKAVEKIAIFPATPYEGYIIYESLAVFWFFIGCGPGRPKRSSAGVANIRKQRSIWNIKP